MIEHEQRHAYSEHEAALYLGVSAAAMRLWRAKGTGPAYFRAGSKLIRYLQRDLDGWIEGHLSQPAGAKRGTDEEGL